MPEDKLLFTQMLEDKWSWKRFWMLCLIAAVTGMAAFFTYFWRERTIGERFLLILCSLIFAVFFILYLEWNRIRQGIYQEKANNYTRIALFYLAAAALTVLISYLPAAQRPVILGPAMMLLALDAFAGLMCSGYFAVLLCMAGTNDAATLACSLLLGMFGCVVLLYRREKGSQLWTGFMIFSMSFCMNAIFSALGQGHFSRGNLFQSLTGALMSCVGISLLFQLCNDRIENSKKLSLDQIMAEDYELAAMMRSYSKADYDHARRVAEIARGCAVQVGADQDLCAAAGLYYRIGRLEGKPYVQNGVLLAKKRGFPPELIQILAEYNGEKLVPSTLESALVHITDSIVTKFDILDKSTLSSSWNQDIVVYQTLNENSAKGLYDKAGLSMNLFLTIRDYLIKEAPLYDNSRGKQQQTDP